MFIVKKLFIIRHGETDWNAEGRLQGRMDIDLNEKGRIQSQKLAKHWRNLHQNRADDLPFYVSPMRRTKETAEIMRKALGLAPEVYQPESRLKELAFGAWEGKTWREIREQDPHQAALRDQRLWDFTPPGGESYAAVAQRVEEFLHSLDHPQACLVVHGGVARVLKIIFGKMSRKKALHSDIWQGKILELAPKIYHWHPMVGHDAGKVDF